MKELDSSLSDEELEKEIKRMEESIQKMEERVTSLEGYELMERDETKSRNDRSKGSGVITNRNKSHSEDMATTTECVSRNGREFGRWNGKAGPRDLCWNQKDS